MPSEYNQFLREFLFELRSFLYRNDKYFKDDEFLLLNKKYEILLENISTEKSVRKFNFQNKLISVIPTAIACVLAVWFFINREDLVNSKKNDEHVEKKVAMDMKSDSIQKLLNKVDLLANQVQNIDTTNKFSKKTIHIFSDKTPEYSGDFLSTLSDDGEGTYKIQLDNAPNREKINKVLYLWGNGEKEQVFSTKRDFFNAQFKTSKKILIDSVEILIFYKNRSIKVWKD